MVVNEILATLIRGFFLLFVVLMKSYIMNGVARWCCCNVCYNIFLLCVIKLLYLWMFVCYHIIVFKQRLYLSSFFLIIARRYTNKTKTLYRRFMHCRYTSLMVQNIEEIWTFHKIFYSKIQNLLCFNWNLNDRLLNTTK